MTREDDRGRTPAVVDGVIQHLSPSGLTTADHASRGGCLRKWFYQYVLLRPRKESASAELGKKYHSQIEAKLQDADADIDDRIKGALTYVPEKDLLVEHKIGDLSLGGHKVLGYIDIVNPTGTYVSANGDVESTQLTEVLDWKTTADVGRYGLSVSEMLNTIQMTVYGMWVLSIYDKGAVGVLLSHVYIQTKGKPCINKVIGRRPVEDIYAGWTKLEKLATVLTDLAKETDINKVPANPSACFAFGRCHFFDECPKNKQTTHHLIYGEPMAEQTDLLSHIKNRFSESKPEETALEGFRLYINAIPQGEFTQLDGYVRSICKKIEEKTECTDIRCSSHESLSFGKWKGVLASTVRAFPPDPGTYQVTVKGDEISEVVATTLYEMADGGARGY